MLFGPGDILCVDWSDTPIRVIQADAIETFYDAQIEGVGWTMARARTSTFYRMPSKHLSKTVVSATPCPYSIQEQERFRPDLPMRLFRHRDVCWTDSLDALIALDVDHEVASSEVALIPFGKKGAARRPVRVRGSNGSITMRTIIEQACAAQEVATPDVGGVGLYRSGLVGGIPSYYLWGAIDQAGNAA
ncbi:hypothetical protein [Sphingomonas sp. SAFR-052]|uniref:hypothetical protein n=1 Tax=Sphingomonas sp. SAFR-052 TaxID=3436867 RepID=UPI003F7D7A6F